MYYQAEESCHCGGSCGPCSWETAAPAAGSRLGQAYAYPNQVPPTPQGAAIQAALPGLEAALDFVPVVGPIASSILQIFGPAFANIGRGRHEADEIVPTQNQIVAYLGQITNQLTAQPPPNVPQLQAYLYLVAGAGTAFKNFVQNSRFTDGRASQQALNTVMPYIDGTCGYHWPPPMAPQQYGCITWGDGTPGGPGTDGMYGAIQRAIVLLGGDPVPTPPSLFNGLNSVPSIQSNVPGLPNIPQAGTLPMNPYTVPGQPIFSVSSSDLTTYAPYAVAILWLVALSRKRSVN